ncbi:hypothetical protein COCMIDRAFT_22434 [Bipolaris oryzae ATCC 44560]|uniref:Uncharacterized protein n=1 Tax=Bipolaris oryzae ATCC 44560 TaxID=930090 RepID=W6ZJB4_COCMI|nr:uncharacterized protein COCMIDRAFT_22434 [Bipolaris oryzae ATCC 44560]EUC50113.1 hypothetical protein COCMIDRAFT_22434 [Bipolaris oryzae ATCC 44560]
MSRGIPRRLFPYRLFGVDGQVTVFRQTSSMEADGKPIVKYLTKQAELPGQLEEEERRENQCGFLACKSGIMVATTAFNAGVDVPESWIIPSQNGKRCVVRILLGDKLKSFFKNSAPPSPSTSLRSAQTVSRTVSA